MSKFDTSPLNPLSGSNGVLDAPSGDLCSFTIISGFDPAYIAKHGRQSAANSDPSKSVCITNDMKHIKALPRDELVCILPYEIANESETITKTNFVKSGWRCIDIDNNKNDGEKWGICKTHSFLAEQDYTFFITGSPTNGNLKVFVKSEMTDNFDHYAESTKALNTMKEGLGDYRYQGRVTFVKGYICGHQGNKLFSANDGDKAAPVQKKSKKAVMTPKQDKNATQGEYGDKKMDAHEIAKQKIYYDDMMALVDGKETIAGRVERFKKSNGAFNIYSDDEKSKGGYFFNPEKSIKIHHANGESYFPNQYFVVDEDNHNAYNFFRMIEKKITRIHYLISKDENLAKEEIVRDKRQSRKWAIAIGAKEVIARHKNSGKRNTYYKYKDVRYYKNDPKDMMKLINAGWRWIKECIYNSVSEWMAKLHNSKHSKNTWIDIDKIKEGSKVFINSLGFLFGKGRCSKELSSIYKNNSYKGNLDGWIDEQHKNMIDAIQEMIWKKDYNETEQEKAEKKANDEKMKETRRKIKEHLKEFEDRKKWIEGLQCT